MSKLRKAICQILDEYAPFDNWKNTSRALNEIKDLVYWLPPDERPQSLIPTIKNAHAYKDGKLVPLGEALKTNRGLSTSAKGGENE